MSFSPLSNTLGQTASFNNVAASGWLTTGNYISATGRIESGSYIYANAYVLTPTVNATSNVSTPNLNVTSAATLALLTTGSTTISSASTSGYNLRVLGNQGVDMEGGWDGGGQSVNIAAGKSAFLWLPKKGSLRIGFSSLAVTDSTIGAHSFSFGNSLASGWNSYAAVGANVPAANAVGIGPVNVQAGFSTVVGSNNIVEGTLTAWNWNEPLFVVGNGYPGGTPSNALTIYKNGAIKIIPQGDISMGMYGN